MTKITVKVLTYNLIAITLSLVFFAIPGLQASAIPLTNCGKSQFSDFHSLVNKVAVLGNDDRKTFPEYAKEKGLSLESVERAYSATGLLTCDNQHQTTAQLTGNNSVVTTAAHTFFDNNCKPIEYKSCLFSVFKRTHFEHYNVNLKSLKSGGCQKGNREIDWAVVELSKPVRSTVNPYRLPPRHFQLSDGDKLIQISGFAKNFVVNKSYPRHIIECRVREINKFEGYPVQTDCDSGVGASGSAQLIETALGPIMVGMNVSQTIDSVDGQPYDSANAFNVSTQLTGAFYNAIATAVANTGGPRTDTAKANQSGF